MALIAATACTTTPIDDVTINANGSKGQLQVVGRVTQFSDCEVATRSKKDGDEPKITSMGLALFPIDNGVVGDCLYYDYKEGSSIVFVVDRHEDVFDGYDDKNFVMYIFANMQNAEDFPTKGKTNQDSSDGIEGVGKSLEYFTKCATAATANVEDVPTNGFPMMGSLGALNTNAVDGDEKTLILKPTASANNVDGLPVVNGTPTDNLEIPLKAMYAKFTFTISVKPDQEIVGNKAPRFDLVKYSVNNIATGVDTSSETNSDTAVIATSGDVSVGKYAQGATTATFDFYLPERQLKPATSAEKFNYPFGENGANIVGYSNLRDEDKKYAQRFKGKLVGDDQKATYLTINGKYTDHQGYTYNVDYKIYLGGDNYSNFDILRNTHYINDITIRGIANSADQATNTNAISVDHRVNVERSTPLVINFRRETLLDAHFEVRPLRLRLVGENLPSGTSATVQVLNENGGNTDIPSWVRLEASGSSANHITSGTSAGKRKYFTTDLVTNTLKNNTTITVNNLTTANQTVWVYVDENASITTRAAVIRVTYQNEVKDYKITQNGLYAVATTRNADTDGVGGTYTYYIEQYEEYLYNYDAEDSYGQTEWNGMEWGLNDIQLSNLNDAFYLKNTTETSTLDWLLSLVGWNKEKAMQESFSKLDPQPKYDFYIFRDTNISELTIRNFDGWNMNDDIQDYLNSKYGSHQNTGTDDINNRAKIEYIALDESPKSAFAYCYNRNKRDANGKVVKIEWYLPAIDEIEDIAEAAHGAFKEFQGNLYWSCQPAYDKNEMYVDLYRGSFLGWNSSPSGNMTGYYYTDDLDRARATRALRENETFAGVLNSGADVGIIQYANVYAAATNSKDAEYTKKETINTEPYKGYPGNLPRTGQKARVRCVRKMN